MGVLLALFFVDQFLLYRLSFLASSSSTFCSSYKPYIQSFLASPGSCYSGSVFSSSSSFSILAFPPSWSLLVNFALPSIDEAALLEFFLLQGIDRSHSWVNSAYCPGGPKSVQRRTQPSANTELRQNNERSPNRISSYIEADASSAPPRPVAKKVSDKNRV
uniref:Uncharacterized protein n=1 Tax=Engystomops pustulosus TaxID=76066 RepID=A0AAV6YCA9_ENGPU|nr:hypothetical protein GDO81_029774 [Engystomops pustulosus]